MKNLQISGWVCNPSIFTPGIYRKSRKLFYEIIFTFQLINWSLHFYERVFDFVTTNIFKRGLGNSTC